MRVTPATNIQTNGQAQLPGRIRLGMMLGLTVLTVIILLGYLTQALHWREQPFLGVMVDQNMVVTDKLPNGTETWTGREAGLLPGDQLVSINGQILSRAANTPMESQNYQDVLGAFAVGEEVTVEFYDDALNSDSRPRNVTCETVAEGIPPLCSIHFTLMSMPDADFVAFFGTPFFASLIALAVAAIVLYLRYWDPAAFLIVVIALFLSLFMAGLFDLSSSHRYTTLWLSNSMLLGGSLLTLGLVFPMPTVRIYKQPWLRFAPIGLSLIFLLYLLMQSASESIKTAGQTRNVAELFVFMSMAILAALLHAYQRPRATTALARDQAISILIGVVLGLVPTAFWFAAELTEVTTGELLFPFSIEVSMLFFIVFPVSLAYATLEYRRFDGDQVLVRAASYSTMLVVLMMGYFLVVVGASLFTTGVMDANNPFLIVITIFFISVLFVPLRSQLQERIEEIYFKTRRDYQEKQESFSRQLTSLAGTDIMIREFRHLLASTIRPTNTLIFLINNDETAYVAYGDPEPETHVVFDRDSGVIQLLKKNDAPVYLQPGRPWPLELRIDRARLGIIRVMVIAKMVGAEKINGFVCVGAPLSNANAYDFEELRFINNLVSQLAVAIERDQVIQSLERRVQELDVLSHVGQAVNFTIEQDDMVELVSAQSLRLIPSPFFYIVLHDATSNQFEYAFFLENDERYKAYENKKWLAGNDLYSDVIKTNHPVSVDNYVREMRKRNVPLRMESPETKAWVGVPLISGTRTLGVLAVGESDASKSYTEAQLRILGDISALTATSMEKARLFSETNIRARQMAALNDISRQLVATEGDVELLLDLITSSAVDILNAEAGSLLLTVEDGSMDLEFKTAIGGTGHDLVGTRLPAGYGLVGKVAKTGKPVISNDASADEDFDGEVDQGFRTKSLLAVPLPGKNEVVGVLEVINKRDGTNYAEEDVELLTTFAGQAAVAIENARLFQQTDIQLTRRVQELEALERIDRELNRALNLEKVAYITVEWAIKNSRATAGVLGIIDDEHTTMEIVTKIGYDDEDVPKGANGNIWPVDQGILKRVLHNRRSDLQPNVEIDPNYAPMLRESLSQITVPMVSADEVIALLILETKTEPRLNLLDLDWAQRLAEHASIAIANVQLYTELTRANESKSEFMAFAAHELKNPLTSVRGYTDTLLSPMGDMMNEGQRKDFFGVIRSNADRMQVIINDLRDIARIDADQLSLTLSPITVQSVVDESLKDYQARFEAKQQTLVNNIPEDTPLILGDRIRLIQVLTNIISNAYKYSPEGSTITLSVKEEGYHRNNEGKKIGPALRISVADTGYGMAEDDLQKLFRVRYFRSEEARNSQQPGTGLGMMITQDIINKHNGVIWVESTLGKGTIFHFVIPLAPEEPEDIDTEDTSRDETAQHKAVSKKALDVDGD